MSRAVKRLHVVMLIAGAARCGRAPSPAPSPPLTHAPGDAASVHGSRSAPAAPFDPAVAARAAVDDLWRRASDGEADDLARLADREGATGLIERATAAPGDRLTALRALAYADGHASLPFLAAAASGADDAEARAALASLADIAARRRRAVDAEDGAELREGCDVLLALARDTSRPRGRRIGAIRALRMMSDVGCAPLADIPTDLDAAR